MNAENDTNATLANQLGRKLRSLREAHGLKQGDVALNAAMSQSEISKYETGRHLPSLEALPRLLRAIGASAAEAADLLSWLSHREGAMVHHAQHQITSFTFARDKAIRALRSGHVRDAWPYIQSMRELAETDLAHAYALLLEGQYYVENELHEVALRSYRHALRHLRNASDRPEWQQAQCELHAHLEANLADLHFQMGNHVEALALVDQLLSTAVTAPGARAFARFVRGKLAVARRTTDALERGRRDFATARSEYASLDDHTMTSWVELHDAEASVLLAGMSRDESLRRSGLDTLRSLIHQFGPATAPEDPDMFANAALKLAQLTDDAQLLETAERAGRANAHASVVSRAGQVLRGLRVGAACLLLLCCVSSTTLGVTSASMLAHGSIPILDIKLVEQVAIV